MDWLHLAASISSIASLIVSAVTLLLVSRIRDRLRQHSRHGQLTEIIDRILRIPATKETLPESTCREIHWILRTVRAYEFSYWFFLDRRRKGLAKEIERELESSKRRMPIQNNLRLLRDEVTLR